MENTTYVPPDWIKGGVFVENIENILTAGKQTQITTTLESWCMSAISYAKGIEADDIRDSSRILIQQAPYVELADHLDRLSNQEINSLTSIRMIRKLFVIARDGIILTTDKHFTDEFKSLRKLCISLGRIADTNGVDSKHITHAQNALDELVYSEESAEAFAHDNETFQDKIVSMIDVPTLEYERYGQTVQPDAYHQARKNFRRVSNMFLLEAANNRSGHLQAFASKGVQLNRRHGSIADHLDNPTI